MKDSSSTERAEVHGGTVKYDAVGRIAGITGLTRRVIAKILKGISRVKFEMFRMNPEVFIAEASRLIAEQKNVVSVGRIEYRFLDEVYGEGIFTALDTVKQPDDAVIPTPKHGLYNYAVCDSEVEREFAREVDVREEVPVHVKLPAGFWIPTPGGKYNPDWAIAFKDGTCFVAETKGSESRMDIRLSEDAKIACAREYFRAAGVRYEQVSNFGQVMNYVME